MSKSALYVCGGCSRSCVLFSSEKPLRCMRFNFKDNDVHWERYKGESSTDFEISRVYDFYWYVKDNRYESSK